MDQTRSKRAARLWTRQQTKQERGAVRPVVLMGLVGTVLAVGQAGCVASILAGAFRDRTVSISMLIAFAGLGLARAVLVWVIEQAAHRAGAVARRRLRSDIVHRLLVAGPALLRTRHSADLTAMIVDRVEALEGLFSRWVPAAMLAVMGPAVVALAVLVVDPMAALVLVAAGLLVPVGMALSGIGAAAASRRQFLAMARLQARFLDRVRGIATIVINNRTESEALALAEAAQDLRQRTMRVLRVAFLSSAALDCAAATALVILALRYGGRFAADMTAHSARILLPSPALYVLLLVPEFFAPLRNFSAAYQDRMHATGAAEALLDVPPLPAPGVTLPTRYVEAHGLTVAFENVRLIWDEARGPALDGLSFRVPAGETLLLVGPSGAGKSSVIEILLGFAKPQSGRVTLNGADLESIVPEALSRLIAWIGQRPVLFAGTISDNIRFARPDATDAEVMEAAKAARVDQFADDLPRGLDTLIGEGGFGLSGGQAQRVAIARAFMKNAPLLLLDEPTSHLDPGTEREVLDSLHRLVLGRTVILASHSAAAQSFIGRKLMLHEGRIVPLQGVA
jgi:ATP-binding cassette subfamily C protein CydD